MKFELEIIKWLQENRNGFTDFLFEFFTFFGEELVVIGILMFIYWSVNKDYGKRLAVVMFLSVAINRLLKVIISRPRPYLVDSSIENLRPETSGGSSMPSGHTQSASTTFFGVYYGFKRKYLLISAIIITILVGFSRLYLGVHYLTDVITGGLLGMALVYLLNNLLDRVKNIDFWYRIAAVIAFIGFLVFFIFYLIDANRGLVFDGRSFYLKMKSLGQAMAVLIAFVCGLEFERKYVRFTHHKDYKRNIIRFCLGIAIVLILYLGLKGLFRLFVNPETLTNQMIPSIIAVLFDFIRYFIIVFVAIGLYPISFKKLSI